MTQISAFSLDLWGTIIVANPVFSEKRLALFKQMSDRSEEDIKRVLKYYKETFGDSDVKTETIFEGFKKDLAIPLSIETIMNDYYALFYQNSPLLIEADIVEILIQIAQHYPLHLVSNTLVVKGTVLRDSLNKAHHNIFTHFQSLTFSDEIGFAKPDAKIFDLAYQKMGDIPKSHVCHIGDNSKTDFDGAKAYGFQAILLEKSQKLGEILRGYISY
jgi:putative hydrolase of the HAD superfamily